jgi:hypothetical protein
MADVGEGDHYEAADKRKRNMASVQQVYHKAVELQHKITVFLNNTYSFLPEECITTLRSERKKSLFAICCSQQQ